MNPDVVVVGAGIVGCAVSDALRRQGCRVRVFDPRGVALGATHASAGMLTPFSEGRHHATLEALGARSLQMYDSFIEQTVGASHRPDWYARTGSLEVAVNETEREELRTRAADHAARGIESSFLAGGDVQRAEPEVTASATAFRKGTCTNNMESKSIGSSIPKRKRWKCCTWKTADTN